LVTRGRIASGTTQPQRKFTGAAVGARVEAERHRCRVNARGGLALRDAGLNTGGGKAKGKRGYGGIDG
jgi:hypothetical protein